MSRLKEFPTGFFFGFLAGFNVVVLFGYGWAMHRANAANAEAAAPDSWPRFATRCADKGGRASAFFGPSEIEREPPTMNCEITKTLKVSP